MEFKDQQMVERLDTIINEDGNFRDAYMIARGYLFGGENIARRGMISAHVWFRLILAATLLGWDKNMRLYKEFARRAPDYSPIMEGDLRRDEMLRAIRIGKFARAEGLRKQIVEFHRNDPNRMAVYCMAVARLHDARGQHGKAIKTHRMADDHWRKLKASANAQWRRNNRFSWARAEAAFGKMPRSLYRDIMADEPRRDRRVRVWVMYHFGKLGYQLDMWLERRASK